jgi:hypothetical protein
MYSVTSSNRFASFFKTFFSFAKFQQSCMICQLKLVFYLLKFYSLLIRITVHFLFCAIPFETDSHTPGLYATTENFAKEKKCFKKRCKMIGGSD